LAGSGQLTFWGLKVYGASLWVLPGFKAAAFARHKFVLELHYLRAFKAADIARRSIDEMRRQKDIGPEQAQAWQGLLQNSFPDVRPGDRIAGLNLPGEGLRFITNGRVSGEIRDPELASLFFGIWLGLRTSEAALRQNLLAGAGP
jgi:hypothetical protein